MAGSIAQKLAVIAVILLVALSLAIYSRDTPTTYVSPFTATSSSTTTETAIVATRTPAASEGSISISSPPPYSEVLPGQALTISGTVIPTPALPDNVLIQVGPLYSLAPLNTGTVPVLANGTFSYSFLIGMTWETIGTISATYVIMVTDSNGATGNMTFAVVLPSC